MIKNHRHSSLNKATHNGLCQYTYRCACIVQNEYSTYRWSPKTLSVAETDRDYPYKFVVGRSCFILWYLERGKVKNILRSSTCDLTLTFFNKVTASVFMCSV